MFTPLVKLLRKPTLLETAVSQLADTERELLMTLARQEEIVAALACYTARIRRLKKYVQENLQESTVEIPN